MDEHFDAVIVGSGFGGSVTAFRLAEAGLRVCLLERGKAYPPFSFPRAPFKMATNFWDPSKGLYGLYNVWSFKGSGAIVSSGLGGGSLIYANVIIRKDEKWFVREQGIQGGYESWPVTRVDLGGSFFDKLTSMNVTATAISIAAVVGVIWFMFTDGQTLRDADKARGLITFSVAIVTVAIALLLVLYVISSNEPTEEVKNKFGFGKDILMVFVGILGTIVGFYYGTDKISTKDIPGIGSQQGATNQLETKAFELLLKQNYKDAVNVFDLASKSTPISPNINNLQAITKYLQQHEADLTGLDNQVASKAWKELYCDISKNNRAVGLSKELNDKFESACSASSTSVLPANRNPSVNSNLSRGLNNSSNANIAASSNR